MRPLQRRAAEGGRAPSALAEASRAWGDRSYWRRRGPAPLEPAWALLLGLTPTAGWRRWAAVSLLFLTVSTEIASFTGQIDFLHEGPILVSWSVFPALGLAALLGDRLLGRRRDHDSFITFWVCAVLVLSVAVMGFSRLDRASELLGLVAASVDEELVYRLALPVMIAAALVGFGMPRKWCRIVGYTLAGIAWILLPGHRAQMNDVANVLTFVEFAFLMALICLRSGSVLATATVHVCSNLLTVLVWHEVLPQDDRSLLFGGLLGLLLLAYGLRTRSPRMRASDVPGQVDVDALTISLRPDGPRRRSSD